MKPALVDRHFYPQHDAPRAELPIAGTQANTAPTPSEKRAQRPLVLRLPDGRELPLARNMTIGQSSQNEVVLRFRTDVTIFVEKSRHELSDSLELATRVAKHCGKDVLAAPPSSMPNIAANPYNWILVDPAGKRFLVHETAPESGSVIIDDERRPL